MNGAVAEAIIGRAFPASTKPCLSSATSTVTRTVRCSARPGPGSSTAALSASWPGTTMSGASSIACPTRRRHARQYELWAGFPAGAFAGRRARSGRAAIAAPACQHDLESVSLVYNRIREWEYDMLQVPTRIAVMLTILLTGMGTAVADTVCDRAQKGTYLSNVCWLMDVNFVEATQKVGLEIVFSPAMARITSGAPLTDGDLRQLYDLTTIVSVDERMCSVTYETMGEENTIYFNNVNPSVITFEFVEDGADGAYILRGSGFSEDGRTEVRFLSFSVTMAMVSRAFTNLYSKYCEGKTSEF